jgi:hypothetical protein
MFVDALQKWIQRGLVEPPVIVDPSPDDIIDDVGEIIQ